MWHPIVLSYIVCFVSVIGMWYYLLQTDAHNAIIVRNVVVLQGVYWIVAEAFCRTSSGGTMVAKEYGTRTSLYIMIWHVFSNVACGFIMYSQFHVMYVPIESHSCMSKFLLSLPVSGILLRIWSMRTMGKFFSRQLRVVDKHAIIDSGPYSIVRHPGYLATLLIFFPIAVAATQDIYFTTLLSSIWFVVFDIRMNEEEEMMVGFTGEAYTRYMDVVKFRIIPCFY